MSNPLDPEVMSPAERLEEAACRTKTLAGSCRDCPSDVGSIPTASTTRTHRTRLCPTFAVPSPSRIPPTAGVVPRVAASAPVASSGRQPPQSALLLPPIGEKAATLLRRFRRSASLVQRRRKGAAAAARGVGTGEGRTCCRSGLRNPGGRPAALDTDSSFSCERRR